MALKKSDLYRSLWQSCDELRGGMDASQYKDYVLSLLFMKYVTDKATTSDGLIEVPEGGSFQDMVDVVGDPEIGDKVNKIIGRLADANDLRNVIDVADFNDDEKLGKGKEMQDRLSKLVSIFNDLDFSGSTAEGDDLLGDAYEYLMRHFATESGKSKGQFYTPAEVSRILAKVVGIGPNTRQDRTVLDATCGSGSLLLKAAAEAPRGLTIYGQEKDNATWALARMNAILHSYEDADIRKGDTITNPQFLKEDRLQTFDFQVANPPFSTKSWSNGLEREYGRFDGFGRPPEKNGDYAFLLHIVKSMGSSGRAAVILPHGVLFRGNAEAAIRKQLIKRGYIEGIIGLPGNLFFGTGIPACILVLDRGAADDRQGIFMIDASKGFIKDGPKNRLRGRDIHKIVDVFNRQIEIDRYSRMVPTDEISGGANDFNLNIPRYIDSSEPEDLQDLHAHLHGGIPEHNIEALSDYWDAFPSLRKTLFCANRSGYVDLAVEPEDVQSTILASEEFADLAARAHLRLGEWFEDHRSELVSIHADTRPNDLIAEIGDDLLRHFEGLSLIDKYDAYELLLSYWHETMHDDVFLVMHDGWVNASRPRLAIENKQRKLSEDPDIVIGTGKSAQKFKMDLIPSWLVASHYLGSEGEKVKRLVLVAEQAAAAVEEFVEEHAVDEGLLSAAVEDDKATKKGAAARLKAISGDDSEDDERRALLELIELYDAAAVAKKAAKAAEVELSVATVGKYGELTSEDVQALVLDLKWRHELETRLSAAVGDLALALAARIEQLGRRYEKTVHQLNASADELNLRVEEHLRALGVS